MIGITHWTEGSRGARPRGRRPSAPRGVVPGPLLRLFRGRFRGVPLALPMALLLGLLLMIGPAAAGADLRVQALFPGKALFLLDGESFLLRDGETGPDGLRLLQATSRVARIEHRGLQQELTLERGRFGGVYQPRAQPQVRIQPDAQGGYVVQGVVNGVTTPFIIDTGATLITLSAEQARAMGLPVATGAEVPVVTASGQVLGRRVLLERVQVGALDERRVEAIVLPGDRPTVALLGMSFLSRMELRSEGPVLVLQTR